MIYINSAAAADLEDRYPVHSAAREGRFEDLRVLLTSGKYDANKGTFELVRPLHEACLAGHIDCVSLLIENGANVRKHFHELCLSCACSK